MKKNKKETEINSRQKEFCRQLIIHKWNQKQAAIAAGYSPKTAESQASRLLTNVKVNEYLNKVVEEDLGMLKAQIRHQVLSELNIISKANITNDVNVVTKEIEEPVIDKDGKPTGETEIRTHQVVEINDTKLSSQSAAIASIKQDSKGAIEIKYHDKIKALDLLGKYGGLWTDKMEISGKIETENKNLNINTSDLSDEEAKTLFFKIINED